MPTPCDPCGNSQAWAVNVLDGGGGTVTTPAPCAQTTWAATVLDVSPSCRHLSHGLTTLALVYAVGSTVTVSKTSVAAIDCGYIDVGSLVFSSTSKGAIAVVIGQTCNEFIIVVISQPSSVVLTPAQIETMNELAALSGDSLGQVKTKFNALLDLLKEVM